MNRPASAAAAIATVSALALAGCSSTASSPGSPTTTTPAATAAVTSANSAPSTITAAGAPAVATTAPLAAKMPDVVHEYLDSAQRQLKTLGLSGNHVATATLGANSVVIEPNNWIVLTQTPAAGQALAPDTVVHLGVVKLNDPKAAGITPRS